MSAGIPKRTRRRWADAAGGNRAQTPRQGLAAAVAADATFVARLPETDPRRRPTLALVRGASSEVWVPLAELERREAQRDRRRNAQYLKRLGYVVLPVPSWRRP
jgi:hypothetical protein